MTKHSVAYRARRQRMRRARRLKAINARLDAFGRMFRERVEQKERMDGTQTPEAGR